MQEKARNEKYSEDLPNIMWHEEMLPENPYLASYISCHGKDVMSLLKDNPMAVDYFKLTGKYPTDEQVEFFAMLKNGILLGSRHLANISLMYAGCWKTRTTNFVPIGTGLISGKILGAEQVLESARFMMASLGNNPQELAKELISKTEFPEQGDWYLYGFGSSYRDENHTGNNCIDPISRQIALELAKNKGAKKYMKWASEFVKTLEEHGMGWLNVSIMASASLDLDLTPWQAASLFQIFCSVELSAHGLSMATKNQYAMPFITDLQIVKELPEFENTDYWDNFNKQMFTHGGWEIGKDVFFYDENGNKYSILRSIETLNQGQLLVLLATRRLVSKNEGKWILARIRCAGWPDPRIGYNFSAAAAGTFRVSPTSSAAISLLTADARLWGTGILEPITDFVLKAYADYQDGISIADILKQHPKKRSDGVPIIPGMSRAIASGDLRVKILDDLKDKLGIEKGKYTKFAFALSDKFEELYNESMNSGMYTCVSMLDLGFSAEEHAAICNSITVTGSIAPYVLQTKLPPKAFATYKIK